MAPYPLEQDSMTGRSLQVLAACGTRPWKDAMAGDPFAATGVRRRVAVPGHGCGEADGPKVTSRRSRPGGMACLF